MPFHGDRKKNGDEPGEGEGRLLLTMGDRQSLVIDGKTRIHFDRITAHGGNGGAQEIRLIIVAPKNVRISRLKR